MSDAIEDRARHAEPQTIDTAACEVCGELPPGAADHDPSTWYWDPGQTHRHEEEA